MSLFQSGQQLVKSLIGTFLVPVDTGGPVLTSVMMTGGTFVADETTPVSVAAPAVDAGSNIIISLNTPGGTVGAIPAVQTITPGTGFTVAATSGDTSTYNYLILG